MNTTTPEPKNAVPAVSRCRCGQVKAPSAARPVKRYGWWGQMALIMGFTARPVRIDWVCATCGTVIESINDPEILERYRYDEPPAHEV